MRNSKPFLGQLRSWQSLVTILLFAISADAALAAAPQFTGTWKQDNDRCLPRRKGDVTLQIDQHGQQLNVETSIASTSAAPRHAMQRYTIDGKVSSSIGADGDTFNTSVVLKDAKLLFTIEEHEEGRVLASKETWSLNEDNTTLQRIRERQNNEPQILVYRRIPSPGMSGNPAHTGGAK